MRYILPILFLIFLLPSQKTDCQYYDTGEDPASIKWMQIKTGKFDVIYPEKYGKAGIDFARSLEKASKELQRIFPQKKFRIPVVIHSNSIQSNGYVAWAPKRIEIYPAPEQNSIPGNPNDQLATHELTHVLQMEGLKKGFSGVMNIFLGEQFTGIVSSFLPLWYLEGDAVFSESLITGTGRGRSAAFQKQLKALNTTPGGFYKYDKILNGSFRDNVPDHYEYGYQMVTWGRLKHDPAIWNKVIDFTAEQPFTLTPVNISLRNSSHLTKRKLYLETFDSLGNIWSKEISKNTLRYESLNRDRKGEYINYYSPVFAGRDSIIAIKTTLSQTPAFVLINSKTKKEKSIHRPGYMYPRLLSFAAGKLLWVENRPDLRWDNRDFSNLKILDINTGRSRIAARKTRYLAASLSPDGRMICAVENSVSNKNTLVILETGTGKVLYSIPSPENKYIQRPQWSGGGEKITVIYLTEKGEGIISYSIKENEWNIILEGVDDIQSAALKNDSLFYVSSHGGTENIFLKSGESEPKQLTRSRFGATDLNIRGGDILFTDYSAEGNSICRTDASKVYNTGNETNTSSFLINRATANNISPVDAGAEEDYMPRPYRKWQHLFRFHSWMPFYADIEKIQSDPLSIRPGFSIVSQNSLSTVITSVSYEYSEDKKHLLHSRVTWKGLYPVIESRVDYGADPAVFGRPPEIKPSMKFSTSVSFPFRFSLGVFSQYLRPSFSTEYSNDIYVRTDKMFDYGQTNFTARLYFSNYSRSALRDIYPEWAQTFDLNFVFAPFDKGILGSTKFIRTSFYLPGILRDNGIRIRFEAEDQQQSKYIFGNRISFPRGLDQIISKNIKFLSADYVFPLAYPDFNISSIFYLKRIRSGLFYDYATATGNYHFQRFPGGVSTNFINATEKFSSYGVQLLADFHALRIPFMISGGAQAAWKDINQKPVISVLFNIDLYGMTLGRKDL